MNTDHVLRVSIAALALWFMTAPASAGGYQQVVDGVAIYFGIVPAEVVRGHPREHPEGEMHGGVPAGESHIMVALFDAKTGERITRAEVTARVSGAPASSTEKRLEPMLINGSQTYGNYFAMIGPGPYQIELQLRLPGKAKPIRARFEWSRS